MNPLTFACSSCQSSIGVSSEYAGMPVSCPHCKQVVTAPPKAAPPMDSNIHAGWASAERSTANLRASQKKATDREDSIFSDPEEDGDDEALFGLDPVKKNSGVEMPKTKPAVSVRTTPPNDLTQPTLRVPGLAAAPASPRSQTPTLPIRKLPVSVPDSKSFAGSLNLYPDSPKGAADDANPFVMEAAIPSEFAHSEPEQDEPSPARRKKELVAPAAADWKRWIVIGLAVYSFFITVVAIWGWMRSPHAVSPVKSDTPATQKAKPR